MTESTLVQIASYATEVEADYVRSLLRENGIPAYVDGIEHDDVAHWHGARWRSVANELW